MSKNIDTMLRFVEAQNNHDSAAVTACFAPDFKRRSAETQWQEMGVGNYADMSDRYWAAFPDTHFEIQHLMFAFRYQFLNVPSHRSDFLQRYENFHKQVVVI